MVKDNVIQFPKQVDLAPSNIFDVSDTLLEDLPYVLNHALTILTLNQNLSLAEALVFDQSDYLEPKQTFPIKSYLSDAVGVANTILCKADSPVRFRTEHIVHLVNQLYQVYQKKNSITDVYAFIDKNKEQLRDYGLSLILAMMIMDDHDDRDIERSIKQHQNIDPTHYPLDIAVQIYENAIQESNLIEGLRLLNNIE